MTPREIQDREAELLEENFQHFVPLNSQIEDPDVSPRLASGLPLIDSALGGGFGRGLHLLTGYAHNGKTQFFLRVVWENREVPIILFTPDESTRAVTMKLLALAEGSTLDEVGDWNAERQRDALAGHFPMLNVCDEVLSFRAITEYLDEAEQFFGEGIEIVGYDYLEYLPGWDDVTKKARAFKALAKERGRWLVLHQGNRSAAGGKKLSLASMNYGGEREADTVIGVYRRVFAENCPPSVLKEEERTPTLNLSILKNKQTYDLTSPEGIRYAIGSDGLIDPQPERSGFTNAKTALKLVGGST